MNIQAITTFGIGRVIRSKDSKYEEGDTVVHPGCPVAEFCIAPSVVLRKIDPNSGISLPDYLSSLGGFLVFPFDFVVNAEQ